MTSPCWHFKQLSIVLTWWILMFLLGQIDEVLCAVPLFSVSGRAIFTCALLIFLNACHLFLGLLGFTFKLRETHTSFLLFPPILSYFSHSVLLSYSPCQTLPYRWLHACISPSSWCIKPFLNFFPCCHDLRLPGALAIPSWSRRLKGAEAKESGKRATMMNSQTSSDRFVKLSWYILNRNKCVESAKWQ